LIGPLTEINFLILISVISGILLTLIMTVSLKKANPNVFFSVRFHKEKTQNVLNFNIISTLIVWSFAFGSVSFAIGNISFFLIYDTWIMGESFAKYFILMAASAIIWSFSQRAYFYVKDNSTWSVKAEITFNLWWIYFLYFIWIDFVKPYIINNCSNYRNNHKCIYRIWNWINM